MRDPSSGAFSWKGRRWCEFESLSGSMPCFAIAFESLGCRVADGCGCVACKGKNFRVETNISERAWAFWKAPSA